jgi:glycosyltransferase involved in cell wall biosynthesis
MKISILTPSYNQGQFIEKNIQSVLSQNYPEFEHIIIDGSSTDNTIEILKKYPHLNWSSKPDEGQADALNKGLAVATGDIIGWINSDDYYEDNIFLDVIAHFKNDTSLQWLIGDITLHYTGVNIFKRIKSQKITYENILKNPDIVKQQGVFFRKQVLNEVGGWNKKLYMVMDFDLWIKIARKYTPKMIHKNYAFFLFHADQKSSPKNFIKQISELNKILIENKAHWLDRYHIIIKKYYYLFKSILKYFLIITGIINKKFATIPLSVLKEYK